MLKNKFSEYLSAPYWNSCFFLLKREVLCEFPPKYSQTTEKHFFFLCVALWVKNLFLLIFRTFYWFNKKKMFKQIQIFLRICVVSNMLRKKKFLSISVLHSKIVTFRLKREFSVNFPKMLQNNRKAYFTCIWLTLGRKTVFINICPLPLIWSKKLFKQIKIFLWICTFQVC